MKKEITVQYAAQSKAVVEKVEIKYTLEGDSENFISNDDVLKEVKELHTKASAYARDETFKRNR